MSLPGRSRHGLRRRPAALGMTVWGPLPETRDMHILWGGLGGDHLWVYATDPLSLQSETAGKRIEHPSANGFYETMAEAQNAVDAFVDAYFADSSDPEGGSTQ